MKTSVLESQHKPPLARNKLIQPQVQCEKQHGVWEVPLIKQTKKPTKSIEDAIISYKSCGKSRKVNLNKHIMCPHNSSECDYLLGTKWSDFLLSEVVMYI